MPVEIKELIVKTEIVSAGRNNGSAVKPEQINALKKQLIEECRRMISEKTKRNSHKR